MKICAREGILKLERAELGSFPISGLERFRFYYQGVGRLALAYTRMIRF